MRIIEGELVDVVTGVLVGVIAGLSRDRTRPL